MKKLLLILTFVLILAAAASAFMCEDTLIIKSNCTMLTPVLNCSNFSYQIMNLTGSLLETNQLGNLSEQIYYLNITQEAGDYLVKLCDGSTREIRVKEDDDTLIIGVIILLPILLAILLIIIAINLSDDHAILKLFFFGMSIPSFFLSVKLALEAVIKFYIFPEYQSSLADLAFYLGIFIWVLIAYIALHVIISLFRTISEQRNKNKDY